MLVTDNHEVKKILDDESLLEIDCKIESADEILLNVLFYFAGRSHDWQFMAR